jgi:small subunit ribosomal protein S20
VSGFNETQYSSDHNQLTSHSHFGVSGTVIDNNLILEVYELANIKSAKKRILVNETKAARNKQIKSKVKTMIKKVDAAVAAGDKELAKTSLVAAVSEIDKACSKGIYHKNTASRKVSRLSKAINNIA